MKGFILRFRKDFARVQNNDYSDPTPIQLADESPQPDCSYTIHKESPNGPIAKYAQLGDVLYHVWECPSEAYEMAVYDCDVIGGETYNKKVIGENGCSEDMYIMPNLIYNENRTRAFVNSNAFNFPDQNNVKINCRIRICATLSQTCIQVSSTYKQEFFKVEVFSQNATLQHLPSTKRQSQSEGNLLVMN